MQYFVNYGKNLHYNQFCILDGFENKGINRYKNYLKTKRNHKIIFNIFMLQKCIVLLVPNVP